MLDVDPAGWTSWTGNSCLPSSTSSAAARWGGQPRRRHRRSRDTIEDVPEPHLIQQGYLQRTLLRAHRHPAIYRHLGLAEPNSAVVRDLLAEE